MPGFPSVGEDFGRYRIVKMLGTSDLGSVYEATDSRLGRPVALKVLNGSFTNQSNFRLRFTQELAAVATVDSPHISQIYDYGEIDDSFYVASQLVVEGDLLSYVRPGGLADRRQVIVVIAQVCDGLSEAHSRGVLHGDIKPSKVLLRPRGGQLHAYLGDFGIGWIERLGMSPGTTAYLAPERHRGAPPDEGSDIYSVGGLLWTALTGRPPYEGTPTQVALAHVNEPIGVLMEPGTANEAFNWVLQRALAKDPQHRFASAAEFAQVIRSIPLEAAVAEEKSSNKLVLMLAGAVTSALLVVGGVFAFTQLNSPDAKSQTATTTPVDGSDGSDTTGEAGTDEPVPDDLGENIADTGLGTADGDGVVTVMGYFSGEDREASLNASIADFEAESGIDIQVTHVEDANRTMRTLVDDLEAPDIGVLPQPREFRDYAAAGNLAANEDYLDMDTLRSTLLPGMVEATEYDAKTYGVPIGVHPKSLVWFSKPAFDAAGYNSTPEDWAALEALANDIDADGISPWCMGWESGGATGWVGTDWLEEFVLRMHGPEVYDQWASHENPFNDPRIVAALDEFATIAKGNQVFGATKSIAETSFAEAMAPAFTKPPRCLMERQGSFMPDIFPEAIRADLDSSVGVFALPPIPGGYDGRSLTGGGELAGLFNSNDPDAQSVMRFIASDEFGTEWAQAGGLISPHQNLDDSAYPDQTTRDIARAVASADVFRFDASDSMPAEVGAGTFWSEMVEWVKGQSSQETADDIENSWPTD